MRGPAFANVRPFLGAEVGASLVLSQMLAHHAVTPELCLLDFAITHCVYGRDRYLDRYTWTPLVVENDQTPLTIWSFSTTAAWVGASYLLLDAGQWACVPVLALLVLGYKDYKAKLGVFKPIVIGALWSYAINGLPVDAGDSFWDAFWLYGTLYASASNLADIKDVSADAERGIETVPVKFGVNGTYVLSGVVASLSLTALQAGASWEDYAIQAVVVAIMCYCGLKTSVVSSVAEE